MKRLQERWKRTREAEWRVKRGAKEQIKIKMRRREDRWIRKDGRNQRKKEEGREI